MDPSLTCAMGSLIGLEVRYDRVFSATREGTVLSSVGRRSCQRSFGGVPAAAGGSVRAENRRANHDQANPHQPPD